MIVRSLVRFIPLLLALLAVSRPQSSPGTTAPGNPKQLIAVEDLYLFDAPRALALAPDESRAVYVRQWMDASSKIERQSLWLVDGAPDRTRPLEPDEPDARSPVFSPDGKWIAFVSTRPRPDGWKQTLPVPAASDPATDIWLMPATGGTSVPLAGPQKPYGRVFNDGFYGRVAFSPDSRQLAFVADDGADPRTLEELAAEVSLVRADQGEGYTGYGSAQVWVADLESDPRAFAAHRIERVTVDDAWYGDPQWSPDGRHLVVHANRTADRESVRYSINKNYDLWSINLQTRVPVQLTSGPGPEVSPRFAPDGKRLACLTIPRKGSHMDAFSLAIVTLDESGADMRVIFNHHDSDAGGPPHPPPSFPLPDDCWDDADHLLYNASLGTDSAVLRVDLRTGAAERLGPALPANSSGDSAHAAARRWRIRQEKTPPENRFLEDRIVAASRVVHWDNGEGAEIDGVFTAPAAEIAEPPYRLVVYPHGGPHSRSSMGFDFTAQVFAAHGYAVFQPNFRGSGGYGQRFIDADRFDIGGGDMRDILTGIDSLVGEGLVDPERQFVYGVSYGGFMTCWLVGHTAQFRAAVAQNAVTDLDVMWGHSDLQSWTQWEFGGLPWEVPEAMRAHSPITYVADVRTPTLILHSRDDRRCPIAMGRMFYQSLLAHGVATEMVIYPDEGHGIRQPRHRADVLRRTLAWFERFDREQK